MTQQETQAIFRHKIELSPNDINYRNKLFTLSDTYIKKEDVKIEDGKLIIYI